MKLFHTEKDKESVYVQMQDIMYLSNETNIPIPASIYLKVFKGIVIVDDSNRFDFVKFDEEYEVNFFRELDFIIDYDQYKNLTDEQLEDECQKLMREANESAEKWNTMEVEERKRNEEILIKYNNIDYMIKFLFEICALKHGKQVMPFPSFVK